MKKYLIVKKYIDELDYASLLSGGAPDDEFDIETKEISDKITYNHTELDIAQIITEVFNRCFAHENTPEYFLDCAKKIFRDLHC